MTQITQILTALMRNASVWIFTQIDSRPNEKNICVNLCHL